MFFFLLKQCGKRSQKEETDDVRASPRRAPRAARRARARRLLEETAARSQPPCKWQCTTTTSRGRPESAKDGGANFILGFSLIIVVMNFLLKSMVRP